MNTHVQNIRSFGALIAVATSVLWSAWGSSPIAAAEREFVGVLALAVEDQVADELELSAEQKQKLLEVVDAREAAAVDLALELKDLPLEGREERLVPFRRESERQGMAVLSMRQRLQLNRIRIRREGLAALGESFIAQQLELTGAQQAEITELLKQRDERSVRVNADAARAIRDEADRKLFAVLTAEQKAAWEAMIGRPEELSEAPEVAPAAPAEEPVGLAAEAPATASVAGSPDAPPVGPFERLSPKPPIEMVAEPTEQPAGLPSKLRFNFRFQPWKDVLEWFAEQADLSLVLDASPQGTFNYSDDREYTPAEAIDLLNSVLLTKGYTLVRHNRMLMLINLEDGIPPNLVSTVSLAQLDDRGEYELVSVLFQLEQAQPEEVEEEVKKLVGPQGSVVSLPKSRQLLITETAGRLRAIRSVIQRIEYPEGPAGGQMQTFQLEYALPEDVLSVTRQLLNIDDDKNATEDGSFRFAVDPSGEKLLVTGKPEMVARFEEILKAVDVPGPGALAPGYVREEPQLEVYAIDTATPESVLAVMQTLLAGLPDVRLALDEKTGNLVALARPSEHKTIQATLRQMERDKPQIEVIRLSVVDPQLAVLSINKLFGAGGEKPDPNAPQVDADPTTRQLLVRATVAQIEQIRSLLKKMGETEAPISSAAGGNWRMVPLSDRAARGAIEQAREIWPSMRKNQIRVVAPSSAIPSIRPGNSTSAPDGHPRQLDRQEPPAEKPSVPPPPAPDDPSPQGNSAGVPRGVRVFFASQAVQDDPPAADPPAEEPPSAMLIPSAPASGDDPKEPPPIVVILKPGGIMIASEDTEALDEFEQLLTFLADTAATGPANLTIFYLKHAKATVVAQTLDQIFGGGTLAEEGGSDGGLMGDLAGAALGGAGGGIVGSLLGLGGGGGTIAPSGSLKITPDTRLNALVVQANPIDLEVIEQLLKILDQKESPEDILVMPKSKVIPILNTQAEEIAEILQQVYRDRMITGTGGGQRPSPEQFMQMLRGSRGGRGGSSARQAEEVQKLSLSVDPRTNSLIVAAGEPLLEEVEQLVRQLDQAAIKSNIATRVVTLKQASPEAVQKALSAMLGESVIVGGRSRTSSSRQGTSSAQSRGGRPGSSPEADAARRAAFIEMMRRRNRGNTGGQPGRPRSGRPPGR